jgi:hypothetical protein
MFRHIRFAIIIAATVSSSVYAQARGASAQMQAAAEMQKFQLAMMAAQQAAMKPGDEALPCEALQKELVSTMNNPAVLAYAEKTNAEYAKQMAAQDRKAMTAEAAAAMAAALSSGVASPAGLPPAALAGAQMTPQQMQRMMAAQQQASVAYMNAMLPIMPALMRSQRVGMLAAMKNCGWATGAGLYPGVAPGAFGGAVPR